MTDRLVMKFILLYSTSTINCTVYSEDAAVEANRSMPVGNVVYMVL